MSAVSLGDDISRLHTLAKASNGHGRPGSLRALPDFPDCLIAAATGDPSQARDDNLRLSGVNCDFVYTL